MTAGVLVDATARTARRDVLAALARQEAGRFLRSPLLALGVVLCGLFVVYTMGTSEGAADWTGFEYSTVPMLLSPLHIAIAMVVALAFHRERQPVAPGSPTEADVRAAGILLGAVPLVLLVTAGMLGIVGYVESIDGFALGDEPGHTEHARFTPFQSLQDVALAVLAVATGAAAGRRLGHRASALVAVFVGWWPTMWIYWLFQARAVMPFSINQVQPVNVRVGPADADPLAFPSDWLLSSPAEYQDFWGRLVVSDALAAWHDLWLVGLSCLFLAMVLTGSRRRALMVGGGLLSAVSVAAQYAVMP